MAGSVGGLCPQILTRNAETVHVPPVAPDALRIPGPEAAPYDGPLKTLPLRLAGVRISPCQCQRNRRSIRSYQFTAG